MKKWRAKQARRKKEVARKRKTLLGSHPVFSGLFIFLVYLIMDDALLNVSKNAGAGLSTGCLLLTLVIFYIFYVSGYASGHPLQGEDVPACINRKKSYVIWMFRVMTVLTVIIPLSYDEIITKWMPNLDVVYYPSQVFLLVLIAPILEELTFRYFFYDQWAKQKFGVVKGILIVGFLFVICHPVGNLNGLLTYSVPTLLFFLMYDSCGLYGSIAAHVIFNFIAL